MRVCELLRLPECAGVPDACWLPCILDTRPLSSAKVSTIQSRNLPSCPLLACLPTQVYGGILETLCAQLDVLRPGGPGAGPPPPPELAAALKPLEELRAALAARLQVRALPCFVFGWPPGRWRSDSVVQ